MRERTGYGSALGTFQHRVSIAERPACVEDRKHPGHWEADMMGFRDRRQNLLVAHERTSRFTFIAKTANRQSRVILAQLKRWFSRLPPDLRHGSGDRDQVGRRRQQDLVAEGEVPQLRIGFESGSEVSTHYDAMLAKVADFFEAEVDDAVEALSSLMEPMIMVVLGTLIGGLVISMYLPIFKMGSVV